MRYFYTDPLAAAWMEDKYRMRFTDSHGEEARAWRHGDLPFDYTDDERFYIHPDSLHLLEPQVGDLIGIFNSWEISHDPNDHDDPHSWAEIAVIPGTPLPFGSKVIQRQGKQFMWPEIES